MNCGVAWLGFASGAVSDTHKYTKRRRLLKSRRINVSATTRELLTTKECVQLSQAGPKIGAYHMSQRSLFSWSSLLDKIRPKLQQAISRYDIKIAATI